MLKRPFKQARLALTTDHEAKILASALKHTGFGPVISIVLHQIRTGQACSLAQSFVENFRYWTC